MKNVASHRVLGLDVNSTINKLPNYFNRCVSAVIQAQQMESVGSYFILDLGVEVKFHLEEVVEAMLEALGLIALTENHQRSAASRIGAVYIIDTQN